MEKINSEEEEEIISLIDFDDERTMPAQNSIENARMWQFGLPQCKQPFDRFTLNLLSDRNYLFKIASYHKNNPQTKLLSPEAIKAQKERLELIAQRCEEELKNDIITLTPQLLFFFKCQNFCNSTFGAAQLRIIFSHQFVQTG